MTDKIQFFKWCLRKLFGHLYLNNGIVRKILVRLRTNMRESTGFTIVMWVLFTMLSTLLSVLFTFLFDKTGTHLNEVVITTSTISGLLFISTVFSAWYDMFKEEQADLMSRLKD